MEKYYLDLDEDVEAGVAIPLNFTIGLKDSLTEEYKKQLNDISEKAELLGKKEQELIEREKNLIQKEKEIHNREKTSNETRQK